MHGPIRDLRGRAQRARKDLDSPVPTDGAIHTRDLSVAFIGEEPPGMLRVGRPEVATVLRRGAG
jgi:hypothetical protein